MLAVNTHAIADTCLITVEPLNNGHVWHFVLYREVVLSSEVTSIIGK